MMINLRKLRFPPRLQPRILALTFGASLLPVLVLISVSWRFVHQPLIELEKTRLDDQVLAFRGYTAATQKGLQNLVSSYAFWTDLFNGVNTKNKAWIRQEVTQQLIFSTSIDVVKVLKRPSGEVLGEGGLSSTLTIPSVEPRVKALQGYNNLSYELIDTGERGLLILAHGPIRQSDGSGSPVGTLIVGEFIEQNWLRRFSDYSQPSTKLEIFSLDGESMVTMSGEEKTNREEVNYVRSHVLPLIRQGDSVYRIEPQSGINAIYAPIMSGNNLVAIVKIQIVSKYFNQAFQTLTRLIWIGLGMAVLLSVAIAHLLAQQISHPITQLAQRSQTLAQGDLTSPIPGLRSGCEIGQLAHAYQEMATSLKTLINNLENRVAERTAELETARQTLEERVQQRTEELYQKNQQLQIIADDLSAALHNLRMTQAQLIQTEKMSSLGHMVAGISHEINNPINSIYGNLTFINRYTQTLLDLIHRYQQRYPDPEIQKYAEDIELDFLTTDLQKIISSMKSGAERISEIILSLRNFSRHDEAETKTVNIHDGIDSTLLLLQHRLNYSQTRNIEVIKNYSILPFIECYPRQLNQVFMHIISNAIDALEINHQQPNRKIIIQTLIEQPQYITIKVIDNGCGIPQKNISNVFDPFFTTKPVGKGTGLGLTVSYQILQNHQGDIKVISQPGQGTEVIIELPLSIKNYNSHNGKASV